MDNIFITGANGFLGSNLVKHFLGAGYEVLAVIRAGGSRNNLINFKCQIVEYNGSIVSLTEKLNANTTVIHTASYYVAEHGEKDLSILINSNLEYGLNLLEAMRLSGAKKIVNIGTAWQGYQNEERRPVNLYAATKQAFEDFIAYYCDAERFSAISLRLNDTYGEKDKRMKLLKLLIDAGITQIPLNMSGGEQRINLTHISDVCRAVYASVEKVSELDAFNVYNLSSLDEYSLKELVNIIEDELELSIPINFGAREYRTREVMKPLNNNKFNLYGDCIGLREGIRKVFSNIRS